MFRYLVFILCFVPSVAFGEGFFDQEAEEERGQWELLKPDADLALLLSQEKEVASQVYRIEINLPARKLSLYQGGDLIQTYPVAVGSHRYETPIGPRYLRDVTWNPWWFPPDEEWAKDEKPTPPGPENPLGRVKMSLGGDIYLHGTNAEGTVGQPVSHGCMRMRNRDAANLAWFFQSRFSSQDNEKLLERYRQNRRQSFYVKLEQVIPVTIIYDRVAIHDKKVVIYPDIYGRERNLWREILSELATIGISPWDVDPVRLEEIEETRGSKAVSIRDLLTSSGL